MSSRGGRGHMSSRRLPPLILLLLAAAAVALGPALGPRSGSGTADAFGSAAVGVSGSAAVDVYDSAAFPAGEAAHAGNAGGDRHGTDPAPLRVALRHASPTGWVLERPTFDALLPAVALAGPLLALVAAYGGDAGRPSRTRSSASARCPPALLA